MRTLRPIFLIGFASCVFVFINPVIAAVLQVSTLFFFKKAQLRENQWLIPGAIAIFGAVASYISFSISISTVLSWDTYALAVSQQAICNAVSISSTVILQFILIRSVFIAAGVQYTELQDDTDAKAKRVRDLANKYEETRTDLTQRAEKAEHELDEVMLELARVNKSREELTNRAELAEQQLSKTTEDLAKAHQLITDKEESLVQASAQCRKLGQDIHTLEAQKADLESKQQKLSEELESSHQILTSKLRLIDDLQSTVDKSQRALKSERENVINIRRDLESKTSAFDAASTYTRKLEQELNQAHQELDKARAYLANSDPKLQELQSSYDALQQTLKDKDDQVTCLTQDFQDLKDVLGIDLKYDNSLIIDHVLNLQATIANHNQRFLGLESINLELVKRCSKLTSDLATKTHEYDQLESQTTYYLQLNQSLSDQLQKLTLTFNSEKHKLQSQIQDLQYQLSKLLEEYASISNSNMSDLNCQTKGSPTKDEKLVEQLALCYRQIALLYMERLDVDCHDQMLFDIEKNLYSNPPKYAKSLRYLIDGNMKLQQDCRRLAYFVRNISYAHEIDLDTEQCKTDLIYYYKLRSKLSSIFGIVLMGDLEHDLSILGLSPSQEPSRSSFVASYTAKTQISVLSLRESLKQLTIRLDKSQQLLRELGYDQNWPY